jgi:hypothetical protein
VFLDSMNSARLKEIMDHAEVLFKPEEITLRDKHEEDLRRARYDAEKTHNSGALFPAEAKCYVAHSKALVVTRAKCLAEAYESFGEAAGREANAELSQFFSTVVAVRRMSFESQARLTCVRTNRSDSQISGLAGGFEREAHIALLEGQKILDVQRTNMKNKPPAIQPIYSYSASGSARITIGTDNSTNLTVTAPDAKSDGEMPESFQAALLQTVWPLQRWKRALLAFTGLIVAGLFAAWIALPESQKNKLWDRITPPAAHSASPKPMPQTNPVVVKP